MRAVRLFSAVDHITDNYVTLFLVVFCICSKLGMYNKMDTKSLYVEWKQVQVKWIYLRFFSKYPCRPNYWHISRAIDWTILAATNASIGEVGFCCRMRRWLWQSREQQGLSAQDWSKSFLLVCKVFLVFLLVQCDMNTWGRALKFSLLASSD